MSEVTHLLGILTTSIFIQNILLANFLGMCSFLAVSKKVDTAMGLGIAVVFVSVMTAPINWIINYKLLEEGSLEFIGFGNVDLTFLRFIIFIAVIAAIVQVVEIVIEKASPALYNSLGIFLPLIAVNCAILGVSSFMIEREYSFSETIVYSIGSGIGWWLAIISMASIREKITYSNIPEKLEGLGITMITTGIMALGFMCFGGIDLMKEDSNTTIQYDEEKISIRFMELNNDNIFRK
jgi:Na+-transporting NADH:ubiquinone oxidoreductase subunit E